VLQQRDGRLLIEDYTFNYLAAGKDLLGFGESEAVVTRSLLIGDPDFDMKTVKKNLSLKESFDRQ